MKYGKEEDLLASGFVQDGKGRRSQSFYFLKKDSLPYVPYQKD